jgi:hypothetical protein
MPNHEHPAHTYESCAKKERGRIFYMFSLYYFDTEVLLHSNGMIAL